MTGWPREEIHVLAPAGVARPHLPGLALVLPRTALLDAGQQMGQLRCHRIAPALVLAAASFRTPRAGCGLLAAGVQQRLTCAADLRAAVAAAPRARHHAALLAAADDIAMGAQALAALRWAPRCRGGGRGGASGPRRWFDDQLRQNELSLSGTLVLRYPSVVVRTEPALVVGQLRRALLPRR